MLKERNISGLGTISLGSIIFFVGTGEKGFKTQELRLIGPALAGEKTANETPIAFVEYWSPPSLYLSLSLSSGIGAIFCILRILFCVCPSHCISQRDRNKKSAKVDADHRTSLLRDTKRVSIAKGPYINVSDFVDCFIDERSHSFELFFYCRAKFQCQRRNHLNFRQSR